MKMAARCKNQTKNAICEQGQFIVASLSCRGKREQKEAIRMVGTDKDPFMKKMGFDKKFAFDLQIKDRDHFSITTIYIDNRTETEKLIPAFVYSFIRNSAS